MRFGDYELRLEVPEGVWNPTPHGMHLGEVLAGLDFTGEHVLELGTGCGIHAILLALRGARRLTLTESAQPALENALYNLRKHGATVPTEMLVADWTRVEGDFDSVVANPPFAKAGKRYRRYFIDTLILDAHKLVKPEGGRVIFVQSSMADIPRSMALMAENGMAVRVLGETDHPFRQYYFEDPEFLREMAALPGAYSVRDGKRHERLIVLEGRISP